MDTVTKDIQVNVLILNMAEIGLKTVEMTYSGPVLQWKSLTMEGAH